MSEAQASAAPTIVLVHGGFVDGSGWEGVYKLLKKDGYDCPSSEFLRQMAG